MHCPRCQAVGLHTGEAEAMTVHACGQCGGVWLGPADAPRLLQWVTVQPWQEPVQVACPNCRQIMHGKYVPEANVVVDECSGHGFWFDRYEMEHVAGAVARMRGRPEPKFPAYAVAGPALAGVAAASAVTAAMMAGGDDVPPEDEPGYAADVAVEAAIWAPELVEGGVYVGGAVVDGGSAVVDTASSVVSGADAAEAAVGVVEVGGAAAVGAAEVAGGAMEAAAGAADLAGGAVEIAGGAAEVAGGVAEVGGGIVEVIAEILGGLAS